MQSGLYLTLLCEVFVKVSHVSGSDWPVISPRSPCCQHLRPVCESNTLAMVTILLEPHKIGHYIKCRCSYNERVSSAKNGLPVFWSLYRECRYIECRYSESLLYYRTVFKYCCLDRQLFLQNRNHHHYYWQYTVQNLVTNRNYE